MCLLWDIAHHISQVNKSVWHEKAQDLSKCKTIRNLFVLNRTMQGGGMSSANEQGHRNFFYHYFHYHHKRFHNSFTLRNSFKLHDLVQDCGNYIANALEISHCCTHYSVLISPLITTWHTAVLFALRHQYFRTGVSAILMIYNWMNTSVWIRDNGQNR